MRLLIKEKKEDFKDKLDLLSILLQTEQDDSIIRDNLINFFVAGRDTTASLLTWTFYYFSQFPDVEKKVIEEIESVLGNNLPTFETLKDLKYLKMVLDEVLRLHPSAIPINGKQAVQNDVLPNGVKVKAGQVVFVCPFIVQRLPKYWGPDANEFRPQRWEEEDLYYKKDSYVFVPFQRGPRMCLGKDMALEEATTVIVSLLQNSIRLRLVPGQKITYRKYLPVILSSLNGMVMNVEKPK